MSGGEGDWGVEGTVGLLSFGMGGGLAGTHLKVFGGDEGGGVGGVAEGGGEVDGGGYVGGEVEVVVGVEGEC